LPLYLKNKTTMKNKKGWIDLGGIIFVLVIIVAICLIVKALDYGVGLTEQGECLKWQKEAVEYAPHYYLVEWQKQQCEHYGITIDAPIL
jgi:surface antigen